jgi:hypothetical protein
MIDNIRMMKNVRNIFSVVSGVVGGLCENGMMLEVLLKAVRVRKIQNKMRWIGIASVRSHLLLPYQHGFPN